ncbi:unnamed protein product [Xylocopa violacea]|uniref:Ribosomal protein eL8/eL30/eS12/Gadd45 domain-containing protein n=1 Tax=Xylocopa violacea TaxID=135666 RepID=A0ABP1P7I9_XYLVO
MSTPVLSKQQLKNSLSAKKASAKKVRNVLAQPQDSYWPVVKAEKCSVLEEVLKKLMPAIKRPPHSIPWSQLKHMKKEERAQIKKEALLNNGHVPNPDIVNSIVLGINAITRSLEKDNVCCILMDANVEPHLLVKHVIHMAQNKKVPVLLLPKLKTVTLNTIGFASAACGLKNIVMDSPDHHFYPLFKTICDIFKDIPLPLNKLQLFKDIETSEQDVSCTDDEAEMSSENESLTDSLESTEELSTDVYMYRSSCKERAFVPPKPVESDANESSKEKPGQDDFISLSNYDANELDGKIKKHTRYMNIHKDKNSKRPNRYKSHSRINDTSVSVKYLPLKVKRLQGNANRVKATKISKQKKK